MAGGDGLCRDAAIDLGEPAVQHVDRRVHDADVDVLQFL